MQSQERMMRRSRTRRRKSVESSTDLMCCALLSTISEGAQSLGRLNNVRMLTSLALPLYSREGYIYIYIYTHIYAYITCVEFVFTFVRGLCLSFLLHAQIHALTCRPTHL